MELTREQVKDAIVSAAEKLSAATLTKMMEEMTGHKVHIIRLEDKDKMATLDMGAFVRAIGAGSAMNTCSLLDDSAEYFYYDETAHIARSAWDVSGLVDNVEALCYYLGHHLELLKHWDCYPVTFKDMRKYFGDSTTYKAPVYEKVAFDDFEKIGRYYGLNDETVAHAKKLAALYFDMYKGMSNENDRVISIVSNIRGVKDTLAMFVGDSFNSMDWEVEFHEQGGYEWYYNGIPVTEEEE